MIQLVVVRAQEDFLRRQLARLLGDPWENALLRTRTGRRPVASVKAIRKAVPNWPHWYAKDWYLHGEELGSDRPFDAALGFETPDTLATTEERCRYFAARYEWALVQWFGSHGTCAAFVTSSRRIAARFVGQGNHMVLGDYRDLDGLDGVFRIATFSDYGAEGRIAWEVAAEEPKPPLIVCRFESAKEPRQRKDLRRFVTLVEPQSLKYGHSEWFFAVYRADDFATYEKVWSEADQDDGVSWYTLSGRADIEGVVREFRRTAGYDDFDGLKAVAAAAAWAYRHTYGGGADEYFAWFAAQDPADQARAVKKIEAANLEQVRLMGLF